jgi:GT2 family glycosyltransferase/SAM-dependent methyltransferase/glycosyltransferase involved in cell wall biosynthesis
MLDIFNSHELEREKWDEYYASLPLVEEDEAMQRFNAELVERISELLPAGGKILEAGCGGGWQSLALARSGKFQVSLMDFSHKALTYTRRLFEREKLSADFIYGDVLTPGKPDFDLVFNAGVLEHYTFEEQVAFLRGMASRSRKYVLVLVPNRLCYWYWLWRIQTSGKGEWPFGKEMPLIDLSAPFEAAGLHFLGQAFMGETWTETFINSLSGMDETLRNEILEVHRSPLIPKAQKCYLVAALGSVLKEVPEIPYNIWTLPPLAEDTRQAEINAALADALALRVGAERRLNQLQVKVARLTQEHQVEVARLTQEHQVEVARLTQEHQAEVARLTQEQEAEVARLTQEVARLTQERDVLQRALDTIYTSKMWRIASKGLRVYQFAEAAGRRLVGAFRITRLFHALKKVWSEPPALAPLSEDIRTRDLPGLPGSLPATYDVIYLASIDWDFRYQRPQQVASQFARHGHRVFYISPARFLPPSAKGRFEFRQVKENIFEILLPIPSPWNTYGEALGDEHVEYMLASLEGLCQEYQIASAVTFVLMASWAPLAFAAKELWGWKTIYDCMDEWDNFPLIGQPVLECEKRLVKEGDLTVVTGKVLYDKWSSVSQHCVLARNGVEFDFFAANCHPNDLLKDVKRPIIGYYGAIAEWTDIDLIEYVASRQPEWSFVLLGGVFDVDVSGLEALPNVHLLGNQPYEHMPLYLYHFDACIIPFKVNQVTHAVDPVKFYEFMSAGKPVVAVKLAELLPYEDYLYLAEGKEEFFQKLEAALVENDLELAQRRIALAAENTWDDRYRRIDQGIKEVHPKASIIIVTYNNADLTQLCVESIYRNTTYPDYEIIIVDNCSGDSTRTYLHYLARAHDNVKIILNATNAGFARANNQGIQAARGDYIVLLNNDTVVTQGWLTTLIGYLADRQMGLVGPVTNFAGNEAKIDVTYESLDKMEVFARKYVQQHAGQYFDIRVLAMYCLAMRRDLVEEVGLLDEGFTVGMFEDDDYANRVREKGYRVICVEDVFIHHFGQAAFKKLLETGEYQKIWDANQRYFEEKWGAWEPHRYRTEEQTSQSTEEAQANAR